jgi:hypothetical protein
MNSNTEKLPDADRLNYLLRKYGKRMLEACPSSEILVLYVDAPEELTDVTVASVSRHLKLCLDCRTKVSWLQEAEKVSDEEMSPEVSIRLPVMLPEKDSSVSAADSALAASSYVDKHPVPSVPFFRNDLGDILGEIGQDLRDRIFVNIVHLPSRLRDYSFQIVGFARDGSTYLTDPTTSRDRIIALVERSNLTPTDIVEVELRFKRIFPG